jgi:PAS domain S-box-containing protein
MKIPVFTSIGSRILGGFLILLSLLLLISWIANGQLKSIEELVTRQVMGKAFARYVSHDIILKNVTISGYVKEYLSSLEDTQKRELRILISDELRTMREEMTQIYNSNLNEEEALIFSQIQEVLARYNSKINELMAIYDSKGGRHKETIRTSGEFSGLYSHLFTTLLKFDSIAEYSMYQAWDNASRRLKFIKTSILALSIAAVVIALILAYIRTVSITRPISRLINILERYARGEHSIRSEILSNDEIGFFAARFNTMLDQLQASQQRLMDIIDFLPDATFVIDMDRKVTAWNRAIEEMTGVRKEDILGKGNFAYAIPFYGEPRPILIDLLFSKDHDISDKYAFVGRKGNIIFAETYFPRPKGQNACLFGHASPLYDRNGNMAGAIESIRDITAQKLAENALRENEERFRTLAESAQDAIIILDNDGNISYWNEAATRIFGYSADEILGMNGHRILSPGRYHEDYYNGFEWFRKTGEGPIIRKTQELTGVKKDGTEFPIELSVSGLKRGDQWNAIGILRDITERRKLEAQFMQSQKMEAIGTLAGGIAHDFNNMLVGIMGSLSLLKHKLTMDHEFTNEELARHVHVMDEAGSRAADIVQQLLTLSRKQEMTVSFVDLNQVISRVMKICATALDKSIELSPRYFEGKALVKGDENQLEQILLNLCINSSHAMTIMRPPGEVHGGKLSLEVQDVETDSYFLSTHPHAGEASYWKVSVRDTGVGMDSKTITYIFDPFFTTKEKGQGTGLGLAMVYNSVKQHNGFIDVYSEIGLGTTINIYIPSYRGDIDREKLTEGETIPHGSGIILVVDDEESVRIVAKSILEECGYDVILATDGAEAVEIFRDRFIEIRAVVLDMVMPKKSGRDAFIEMQKIDPDFKVLLSSGFRLDERVEEVMKLGVKGFIQKPYTMKKLAEAVYKILNAET